MRHPRVGDVVRLKSGGPKMTVAGESDNYAACRWFVEGDMEGEEFPVATLDNLTALQENAWQIIDRIAGCGPQLETDDDPLKGTVWHEPGDKNRATPPGNPAEVLARRMGEAARPLAQAPPGWRVAALDVDVSPRELCPERGRPRRCSAYAAISVTLEELPPR